MGKEKKSKNAFQNDELNELDNTISMKNVKLTINIKDEDRNITKKMHILSNVNQNMEEIEERE